MLKIYNRFLSNSRIAGRASNAQPEDRLDSPVADVSAANLRVGKGIRATGKHPALGAGYGKTEQL